MPAPRTRIDRLLRSVQSETHAGDRRWRAALDRVLGGRVAATPSETAALLGVPTRRQVLRIGGVAIAGASVLAACSDEQGGRRDAGPAGGDEADDVPETRSAGLDTVLANTALSLEVLLVDTYQLLLESELVTASALTEAAGLFQSHHAEHREALIAIVEAAGAEPFTTANPAVKVAFVDPMATAAANQGDLVQLAFDLEQTAAQAYVHAATRLSTPDLRAAVASIGGVEARHAAVLDLIGQLSSDEPAAYPPDDPLPEDARVPR